MNTIGKFLKDTRIKNQLTTSDLEKDTKIKKIFIEAIENENWDELPEYPVVLGFVRNIASTLDLKVETALALLRRDYPPKSLKISPSPDVQGKFAWSPKLTFAVGMVFFVLMLLIYLVTQYINFSKPPKLIVTKPSNGEIILSNKVGIEGETDSDVKLVVNNQPVLVDDNGYFVSEIEITQNTKNLIFVAEQRSGKITEKEISIQPDF